MQNRLVRVGKWACILGISCLLAGCGSDEDPAADAGRADAEKAAAGDRRRIERADPVAVESEHIEPRAVTVWPPPDEAEESVRPPMGLPVVEPAGPVAVHPRQTREFAVRSQPLPEATPPRAITLPSESTATPMTPLRAPMSVPRPPPPQPIAPVGMPAPPPPAMEAMAAPVADMPAADMPISDTPEPIHPPHAASAHSPQGDESHTVGTPQDGFTMVKVYYGTDRAAEEPSAADGREFVRPLTWSLGLAGMAMVLVAVGSWSGYKRSLRKLAGVSMLAAVACGGYSGYTAWQTVGRQTISGETVLAYSASRGEGLTLGTCQVSIPEDHRVGELEAPSILRFEFRQDPKRHVVLLGVDPLPAEKFYTDLQGCVDRSCRKEAFVFVHGFNVKFQEAARRTAQIAKDLNFDGAPIFYSWPSQGKLAQYTVDETNVRWTVPHLRQFLKDIAKRSGAEHIHLVAHSMGNRALTSALRDLSYEPESTRPYFHQVVLTAPDIDAEVFRRDIAPQIVKTAERVTLYASSNDEALKISKQVHGYARAGDSGRDLVVVPGVDTIDVSAVDTSLLGHSYYGSNDTVLSDLSDLIHECKPPEQRHGLVARSLGMMRYWVFRTADTASIPPGTSVH